MNDAHMLEGVATYYAERLAAHGPTPAGVDWNSGASQILRFRKLLTITEGTTDASLNDYGCGYGALADYLHEAVAPLEYAGFDISPAMIATAMTRHRGCPRCRFFADREGLSRADYTVASGIFNVKLAMSDATWQAYVLRTLDDLAQLSRNGFAFNALTTYSDPGRRRADLYYADPLWFFDYCRRRFSGQVGLLHDYPLYEFTILVRLTHG